jgi:hypothetical protein
MKTQVKYIHNTLIIILISPETSGYACSSILISIVYSFLHTTVYNDKLMHATACMALYTAACNAVLVTVLCIRRLRTTVHCVLRESLQ